MGKATMIKRDFDSAAYAHNGEPRGAGPKCATCGELAAWEGHAACKRQRGRLVVCRPPSASARAYLADIGRRGGSATGAAKSRGTDGARKAAKARWERRRSETES